MKTISSRTASADKSTLEVIIETPKGCRNKYKYVEKTQRLKLSKVMPEGMMFPYDFGFIPDTKAEDGDPLDVLVLSDEPTFPACELDCRLIGVIKANQKENEKLNRNDRLVAVALASVLYGHLKELSDLPKPVLQQIEEFFINYQKVRNIEFTILAREGSRSALKILEAASLKRSA